MRIKSLFVSSLGSANSSGHRRCIPLIAAAATVAAGSCSLSAMAGLAGSSAVANYYFNGGVYASSFASGTVNGSSLGTFTDFGGPLFTLGVSNSQVIVNFVQTSGWNSSGASLNSNGLYVDNGFAIFFTGAPQITGVSVNASTNMSGFGAPNVTFNSGAIAIAWQNLSFTSSTLVVLDVATVPAPGAVALLAAAAASGSRRRRR